MSLILGVAFACLALLVFGSIALFQCCEWTQRKQDHDYHENKTHD